MLDKAKWDHLMVQLGDLPEGQDPFPALVGAYAEPHRHYHNAGHIAHCLAEFDSAKHLTSHPNEVAFAIWLHDVVYKPRAKDNEARSADWSARILIAAGCGEQVISRVKDLIMATQHHQPSASPDIQVLLDIDLSILGHPPEVYDVYEMTVRAEYKWVPFLAYRIGRKKVLKTFLDRPRIFQTQFFFEQYESCARQNIFRAITGLGG